MGVVSGSVWTGVFIYYEVENTKNKKKRRKALYLDRATCWNYGY